MPWKLWLSSLPPRKPGEQCGCRCSPGDSATLFLLSVRASFEVRRAGKMYTGTLIEDLLEVAERARQSNGAGSECSGGQPGEKRWALAGDGGKAPSGNSGSGNPGSEAEEFAKALGLGAADRNLGLLLIVHAELVRALKPGNHLADAVDVDQVGAMGAPE